MGTRTVPGARTTNDPVIVRLKHGLFGARRCMVISVDDAWCLERSRGA
jgi:hypothetical protein